MEGPVAAHASRRNDGELVQDDVTGITGYGGGSTVRLRLVIDRLKNDTLIKDSRYPALDMILKYYQTALIFHPANFR